MRRGSGGVAVAVGAGSCVSHDVRLLRSGICRFSALGGLKKDIHFMTGELGVERRCQLPKPARGAEASTAVFMPRGAAQAELTEGAERSTRLRREMNVENGGPAEGCTLFKGRGVAGKERTRWDG